MKIKEIIGKRLTNVFVETRLDLDGLDESDVYLEIDERILIGFPWDFEDRNIEKSKSPEAKGIIKFESSYEIRNKIITDFIMYEDPVSTGYLELENGIIIHEETMFPTGAMRTGFCIIPSIEIFSNEMGNDFLRFTNIRS